MPTDSIGAADGTKRCPDQNCRGREPRRASIELRTRTWTKRRSDSSTVRVARREELPYEVPEIHKICEFCGRENEVGGFSNGMHGQLRWPDPLLTRPGLVVDEVIAVERPPTVEERVAKLEEAQAS